MVKTLVTSGVWIRVLSLTVITMTVGRGHLAQADSSRDNPEFAQRASWSQPNVEDVRSQVDLWLQSLKLNSSQIEEILVHWQPSQHHQLLNCVGEVIAAALPSATSLVRACRGPVKSPVLPNASFLSDEKLAPFARNNLQLIYGCWLTNHDYFEEAHVQLSPLRLNDVVDPASLLFHQAVVFHRKMAKGSFLQAVHSLLENETTIPRRYVTLARLMEADVKPLKEDSLDQVSRMMNNIRIRLHHGRAGTRVRKEEDDVISKLDKMIEKLEQQSQQNASQSGGGANPAGAPMQDSIAAGGSGPGNVDPKNIGKPADWGDLPPKAREQSLQELGQDFPAHYRTVIEQYFRKLAKDQSPP